MPPTLSRRALLAAPLLAACAPGTASAQAAPPAAVPMYRGNAARTGENPGPGIVGKPEARWQVRLGKVVSSSPAVVDGVVYIGSVSPSTVEGGALHAVDAATGIELWRRSTAPGDGIFASPAVGDGVVVTGSYDGTVIAAATSGEERWRFQADAAFYASPAVVAGTAYLADTTGHLYALDLGSGEERWRFVAGQGFERSIASPAVADGVVYAVSGSRRPADAAFLAALDAETGEERWRFTPDGTSHLRGNAIVADGQVYVSTRETLLYAVDAESGAESERYDVGVTSRTQLAVVGGVAYIGSDGGELHAVDLASGERRWSCGLTAGVPVTSSPVVTSGTIFVGDANGAIFAVAAASGDLRWRAGIGTLLSSPAVVGGLLYVGSNSGALRVVGGSAAPPAHHLGR